MYVLTSINIKAPCLNLGTKKTFQCSTLHQVAIKRNTSYMREAEAGKQFSVTQT